MIAAEEVAVFLAAIITPLQLIELACRLRPKWYGDYLLKLADE